MAQRRSFGSIRQLPSRTGKGRWQARYTGPDGKQYTARTEANKSLTFTSRTNAAKWLNRVDVAIQEGRWQPPGSSGKAKQPATLGAYARSWLEGRELAPSTRQSYDGIIRNLIEDTKLGGKPLNEIDQDALDDWWAELPEGKPTYRSHGYQVLRAILRTAKRHKLIAEVPTIEGGGKAKRRRQLRLLEPAELTKLSAELPEPYRLLPILAAHCALRYGEVTALRKSDIDLKHGIVKVTRGVSRTAGKWNISTPKAGSVRMVPLAPSLVPAVRKQVADLAADDLLFPSPSGTFLHAPNFNRLFRAAAEKIGRPDIRVHDLRHFGATDFAMSGATLREIMDFAGHATSEASLLYQHVAAGRQAELVKRMDELINGTGK